MQQSPEGEKDFILLGINRDLSAVRVYTDEELNDPKIFSFVGRRLGELRDKGQLTDSEKSEFIGMFSAWFHQLYDPI